MKFRVCLYNADPTSSKELRGYLGNLNNVRIVAETTSTDATAAVVRERAIDLVVVHFDPDAAKAIETVNALADLKVSTIGISADQNPQTVVGAMRAGCRQFVLKPIDPNELQEAVDCLLTDCPPPKGGRRIAVVGASGGAGATTIACNLAAEFARIRNGAALLDAHFDFGDVCASLDIQNPKATIRDLVDGEIDGDIVRKAMTILGDKLAVLGRPKAVGDAGRISPDQFSLLVQVLGDMYDEVVIDTPRALLPVPTAVLEQADDVLVVMQMSVPSIANAMRYRDELHAHGMPAEQVRFVLNRYRKGHGRLSLDEVAKQLDAPLFAVIPNDFKVVSEALDFGRILITENKGCPVRKAIAAMAKKFTDDGVAPRRGFLSAISGMFA